MKANNEMFKEGSHCICLSVVLIDSVHKMGKLFAGVPRRMQIHCQRKKCKQNLYWCFRNFFNDSNVPDKETSNESDEE